MRVSANDFKLGDIKGNLLSAREGGNSFEMMDISGPKDQMDKLFGSNDKIGKDTLNNFKNDLEKGKDGKDGNKVPGQQDDKNKGPFDGLANLFKGSPLGDFLKGINEAFKGLSGGGGGNQVPGGNNAQGGKTGEAGGAPKEGAIPGGDTAAQAPGEDNAFQPGPAEEIAQGGQNPSSGGQDSNSQGPDLSNLFNFQPQVA